MFLFNQQQTYKIYGIQNEEEKLPKVELTISAHSIDEALKIAWKFFSEYHQVGASLNSI
jgi:hypothetical protein